jgi:hypothetical protein
MRWGIEKMRQPVADPAGNTNIADKPGNKELVAQLSKLLNDGWRSALPPKP